MTLEGNGMNETTVAKQLAAEIDKKNVGKARVYLKIQKRPKKC